VMTIDAPAGAEASSPAAAKTGWMLTRPIAHAFRATLTPNGGQIQNHSYSFTRRHVAPLIVKHGMQLSLPIRKLNAKDSRQARIR